MPSVEDLRFSDDLKEINLLLWEGMPFDEIKEKFPEQYRIWQDRPQELHMSVPTPEGTIEFYPVLDLYEQAKRFWRDTIFQHPNQTILVVAHSAINRALICTALGFDVTHYKSFYQANCGINVLNFSGVLGDLVQLESLNLVTHLDKPMPEFRGKQGIRLLLVRHGETDWNRQKKFQGQIDVPLNDEGRSQSAKAAAFLRGIPIHRAVTSPMLRPKETAEIILQKHPEVQLELDNELREISHGLWEGKLEEEISQLYPVELEQWKRSPELVQMPEGENLQQVWERAIASWDAIVASTPVEPDQVTTVLVVAHDAINKAILCHLMGKGSEYFWTFKQGNGSVTVIDYDKNSTHPLIQSLNITSHLSNGVLDKTAAGAL
jgi:probable phosphoglycerate mutase